MSCDQPGDPTPVRLPGHVLARLHDDASDDNTGTEHWGSVEWVRPWIASQGSLLSSMGQRGKDVCSRG